MTWACCYLLISHHRDLDILFVHNLGISLVHDLASSYDIVHPNLSNEIHGMGEGRIRATWGWISVDRGSKATLPLTIPRHVFKSSAKDSTRRLMGIVLQGSPHGTSAVQA